MKTTFSVLILISLLFSCSTSSKVSSGKLFQKRKYQKGWYVNSSSSYSTRAKKQSNFNAVNQKKTSILIHPKKGKVDTAIKIENKGLKNKTSYYSNTDTLTSISNTHYEVNNKKQIDIFNKNVDISASSITTYPILKYPKNTYSDINTERLIRVLLAIIVMFLTSLTFLAVLIVAGFGNSFLINLLLYIVGIGLIIFGLITLFIGLNQLLVLGFIFLFAAYFHAIFVMIRGY